MTTIIQLIIQWMIIRRRITVTTEAPCILQEEARIIMETEAPGIPAAEAPGIPAAEAPGIPGAEAPGIPAAEAQGIPAAGTAINPGKAPTAKTGTMTKNCPSRFFWV